MQFGFNRVLLLYSWTLIWSVPQPAAPFMWWAPSFARSVVLTKAPTILTRRTMSSSSTVHQVAQRLVENNNNDNDNALVCIAIAGGGGCAISALASTPGASSMLLEGTVTYDRKSLDNYIQQSLTNYVSSQTAQLLSQRALARAMQYRNSLQDQCKCIGVGASSALVQSKPGRISRAHVVATRADGRQYECFLKLAPHNRTRLQEDLLVGRLVLESIENVKSESDVELMLESEDEFQQWHTPGVPLQDTVRVAAERVLLGETSAVVLLPRRDATFVAVPHVVLPNQSLIFPGSFNPPHVGHVQLANAAKAAFETTNEQDLPVLFELSLLNADKPAMNATSVSERAHKIFDLPHLPSNWGVLLTSVP